ncbi:MAG: DNA alkylation repair protein [Cyanobacteria bacterium REEB67]|nr:DNA alkylation repair protein [Cyanobacteria bacterium REEB67]
MPTLASVTAELQKKGCEKTRKIYVRHGMATDKMYGVSVADLKVIAKSIKGQQALACQLYETGNLDAMYLAGMIADGSLMTTKQLNEWVEGAANLPMIAEYTVPWVAVENPHCRDLAMKWIKSEKEHVASAGWCTYAGMVATHSDETLDLTEIKGLLDTAVKEINGIQPRVRYAMNGFVIAVGTYVKPLSKQAKAAARQIGSVSVNMGDTACKTPLATASIEKIEAADKVGKKRKTIRC